MGRSCSKKAMCSSSVVTGEGSNLDSVILIADVVVYLIFSLSSCTYVSTRACLLLLMATCSSPRLPLFLHALSFECTSKFCINFINQFSVYLRI